MLKSLLLLFLGLGSLTLAQVCTENRCETMLGELLKGLPYEAARFPVTHYSEEDLKHVSYSGTGEEVTALWLPSETELASFEEALKNELTAKVTDAPYNPYRDVLEHYNAYKRQYIGAVLNGEKVIIATLDRCSDFAAGQLEARFISVLPFDGGTCFLELVFHPKSKTFPHFYIHGEA